MTPDRRSQERPEEPVCHQCGRRPTIPSTDWDDWYVSADPSRSGPVRPGSIAVDCCPDCATNRERERALRVGDLE